MRMLRDEAELLEVSGHDIHVRSTLRRQLKQAWEHEGALAWWGHDTWDKVDYLCVIGPHASAGELFLHAPVRAEALDPSTWLAIERSCTPRLIEAGLAFSKQQDWELRWTHERPPLADQGELRWLEDAELINAFLDQHAPGSSARPGDHHVRRFAAAFDGEELVAVAADTSGVPGVGHISSVATSSMRRGEGWGAQITSWLCHQMFDDGLEVASLGMYAENHTAIRLYDRIGFTNVRQFSSGTLVEQT